MLREVKASLASLTERKQWGACPVQLNSQNCLSGKYSPIRRHPPPPPHTHTHTAPTAPSVCSRLFWCPAKLGCGRKQLARCGFFFFFSLCKSYSPRRTSRSHQWELQAACQEGGPGVCAPPTAALGGRPAWPRVTAPPATPRASRGVGHAADRVWSVPRPAPGARFSPQCEDAEVRGSYPHPGLKVLCLKAEGRFFFS